MAILRKIKVLIFAANMYKEYTLCNNSGRVKYTQKLLST